MPVCEKCGKIHNGSEEAVEYHKGRCVSDMLKAKNDPFRLKTDGMG